MEPFLRPAGSKRRALLVERDRLKALRHAQGPSTGSGTVKGDNGCKSDNIDERVYFVDKTIDCIDESVKI